MSDLILEHDDTIKIYLSPTQPKCAKGIDGEPKCFEYIVMNGSRIMTAYDKRANLHGRKMKLRKSGAHCLTTIFL